MSTFLTLPLLFTSSAQLPIALLPGWMQAVARVNPVTYTIEAMRIMLNGPASAPNGHAGLDILKAVAILLALGAITIGLATSRSRKAVG